MDKVDINDEAFVCEDDFKQGIDLIAKAFSSANSERIQCLLYLYRDELNELVANSKGAIRRIDFI